MNPLDGLTDGRGSPPAACGAQDLLRQQQPAGDSSLGGWGKGSLVRNLMPFSFSWRGSEIALLAPVPREPPVNCGGLEGAVLICFNGTRVSCSGERMVKHLTGLPVHPVEHTDDDFCHAAGTDFAGLQEGSSIYTRNVMVACVPHVNVVAHRSHGSSWSQGLYMFVF